MASRLRVATVASASRLAGALSPGQADEFGEYDAADQVLVVDDDNEAAALVDSHHNVSWAADAPDSTEDDETTVSRATVDSDGATYECGVNGCSREVDSREDTCWQHSED